MRRDSRGRGINTSSAPAGVVEAVRLGCGRFGVVYKAFVEDNAEGKKPHVGSICAVKEVAPSASTNPHRKRKPSILVRGLAR